MFTYRRSLTICSESKLICITTGINNVDLGYCHRRGITACNGRVFFFKCTATYLCISLDLLHKNSYYHHYVQSGNIVKVVCLVILDPF